MIGRVGETVRESLSGQVDERVDKWVDETVDEFDRMNEIPVRADRERK